MIRMYDPNKMQIKEAYYKLTGREMPRFAINKVLTEIRKYWTSKASHGFHIDGVKIRWSEPDNSGYTPVIMTMVR